MRWEGGVETESQDLHPTNRNMVTTAEVLPNGQGSKPHTDLPRLWALH